MKQGWFEGLKVLMRHCSAAGAMALAGTAAAGSLQPATLRAETGVGDRSAEASRDEQGWPHPYAVGLTAFFDNDGTFAKPNTSTDKHYTAGVGLAAQWQAPWLRDVVGAVPSWEGEFNPSHPGVSYAMGTIVAMQMYTPKNLTREDPIYDDRPYAGWSYVGLIAQRASRYADLPVFEHFEFDGGTVGPSGKAGDVQRWVHKEFGQTEPEGWDNQVRDEAGADFKYLRRCRLDLVSSDKPQGPGVQLLPDVGFVAGTVHSNLNAGATLRAGWNLPDDFGPGSLQMPADYTGPHLGAADLSWSGFTRSLGAYAFVRPAGRWVGHDSTIEGSYFRSNVVEQEREAWVGEVRAGVALSMLRCVELVYSQTYTTHEFKGQNGCDAYGSISLSVTYAW